MTLSNRLLMQIPRGPKSYFATETHLRAATMGAFFSQSSQTEQSELAAEVATDIWDTNPAVLDADMYLPLSDFVTQHVVLEPGRKYELQFPKTFIAAVHPILLTAESRETGCVRVRIVKDTKDTRVRLRRVGDVAAAAFVVQSVLSREEVDAMVEAPSLQVVDAAGTTKWFAHGVPHREDGPAMSSARGCSQWYINHGQLHRAGGLPAVIRPGERRFYVEGVLHRDDDKPAVVTSTKREWYQHGQLHRGRGMPAVILGDGTCTDQPGVLQYWEHGKLHRVDGPATTLQEGSDPYDGGVGLGPVLPAWYFEGKLHREGGPAYKDTYYRHGVVHRDDGPAVVDGARSEWYRDGVRHRNGGPALTDAGLEEWYENGVLHRPDGPARTRSHPSHGSEEWYRHGVIHRDDGPAVVSGPARSEWYRDGVRHRDGGPAVTDAGLEEWYENGVLHRPDGPARTWFPFSEEWYLHGKLHRIGGPARTFPTFWEHYQNGVLHHDDPDVPAQVQREPTTGILFRGFYVRGVLQKNVTVPADARHVAPNGDQTYYLGPGVIGRADGLPAFVGADGTKKWYLNGCPGREGGLPTVERSDGVNVWLDARGNVVRTDPAWGSILTITHLCPSGPAQA